MRRFNMTIKQQEMFVYRLDEMISFFERKLYPKKTIYERWFLRRLRKVHHQLSRQYIGEFIE